MGTIFQKDNSDIKNLQMVEKSADGMDSKTRLKWSFLGSVLFSMAANAFAYFNFYPQHDALNHAFSFAGNWEVQLGRFLLPLIGKIRGNITMPWVIGMLSMLIIGGGSISDNRYFKN